MTRKNVLLWVERGLLATGVALGAWCAAVLLEARFHGQLVVTQTAPLAAASNVGSASAVQARFSAALDPSTVNSQTFTLLDANGALVAGYDTR